MRPVAGKGDADVAEIRIFDSIGYWGVTAADFAEDLAGLGAVDEIRLLINSGGGDVFDGFAIYNLLREHPATISTRIEGLAASIASVIALAGDTVGIHSTAFVMIHNPWGVVVGDAAEMRAFADTLDKVAEPMVATYAAKMGEAPKDIRSMLEAETWFTGDEAVNAGFADELLGSAETADESDSDGDGDTAAAVRPELDAYRNTPEELGGTAAPAGESVVDLMRRRIRQSQLEIEIDRE
jgi:ATP-dependent protease ClpP protease subunit